jgi:chromate transporter
MTQPPTSTPLSELIRLFLRLGFTAFGGPAAHIAMFRDEVVTRRQWMTDQHFMDLLGVTNLIPGPNSTEMAIHIGYERAGWRGLIATGVCFILPAALIVGVLAALYVQFGTTPQAEGLLYGVKPVVIAVVAQAIYGLVSKALKSWLLRGAAVVVVVLALLGVNEIPLLFGTGIIVMLLLNVDKWRNASQAAPIGVLGIPFMFQAVATSAIAPLSLTTLFLTFLKIGSVLYGSGYVLLSFLQTDFVQGLGWLTQKQLLDAVAVGQFTPGPVFTTATFVGYIASDGTGATLGVAGAIVATLGIFLPSFVFVWLSRPLLKLLRTSSWLSGFLDGVNAAALALMAAVLVRLTQAAIVDVPTIVIAVVSAIALIRFKINSTWLMVGGAIVGLVAYGILYP